MSDEQSSKTETLNSKSQEAHSNTIVNEYTPTEQEKDTDTQFLLAEFSEMGKFWRHTDSRIETAINFYLTVGAVTLPGIVVLYQAIADIRLFILALLPITGALLIFGFFLVRRIMSADVKKAEYLISLNLIRRYFVDQSPQIAQYLYMPLAQPSDSLEAKVKQLSPYFHRRIALVVNSANSILAGITLSGLLWLVAGQVLSMVVVALMGIGVGIVTLIIQTWLYRRVTRHYERSSE
jgi:hypothetical protein